MERTELVERLIALLLGVMPEYRQEAAGVADEPDARRYLLRCLMNVWDPRFPLPEEYFSLEAKLLTAETEEKRPVDAAALAEAELAVDEVRGYRATHADAPKVIFNVFKDEDRDIYAELLR